MKLQLLHILLVVLLFTACTKPEKQSQVTLESLLDEMVSLKESARLPSPSYIALQESSYDRASVSPDSANWFANADGFGFVRMDTIDNRIEKVLFDQTGPGVITRIWLTTVDTRGTWRFYFDGSSTPGWIIPAYDLMKFGIPSLGKGLLQPHTSYTPDGKGGNTLFLPIPYQKSCKITFEEEKGAVPVPRYYHINYRKYKEGTSVETFSHEVVERVQKKIQETDSLLLNSPPIKSDTTLTVNQNLNPGDSLIVRLPASEKAVDFLQIHISTEDTSAFAQVMRNLVLQAAFDGKQTVWVPLSDFSGGGMGAPTVMSWFLSSNGKGEISSRWLMPYKKSGQIILYNASSEKVHVAVNVGISEMIWDERSLYFHTSWKQETGIPFYNDPKDDKKCKDWNFVTLHGKGIYKGDVLTLFNHTPAWYGEGDEKIWVDKDTFPSHFGTGTEDYYNSSWAPVIPFQTPFGGAPRADQESSHGYNTFFRTRNLDGIPFSEKLVFNLELISWVSGKVDYATTVFWYGDGQSESKGDSGIEEVKKKMLPVLQNPSSYQISGSIEFEGLKEVIKSSSIRAEKQAMFGITDGKWSSGAQLFCSNGQLGDSIVFSFSGLGKNKYEMIVYATKAPDYGIVSLFVNRNSHPVTFDGYNSIVTNSGVISLGSFYPENGEIKLRVEIVGTNPHSVGNRYLFGLDCAQLLELKHIKTNN